MNLFQKNQQFFSAPNFWLFRSKPAPASTLRFEAGAGLTLQSQKFGYCPQQPIPLKSSSHPRAIAYFTLLSAEQSGPPQIAEYGLPNNKWLLIFAFLSALAAILGSIFKSFIFFAFFLAAFWYIYAYIWNRAHQNNQ